tara:strand:+ start:167 stop:664 length:498 start_codon:yes stop_codon:yes gene_type:complete
MYGKYQTDLSAEAVTLELIGLIRGERLLPNEGKAHPHAARAAGEAVRNIEKVLQRDGRSMDRDFRELLTAAVPMLDKLAGMGSHKDTNVYDLKSGSMRREGNPKFDTTLAKMRDALDERAQAVFDEHWAVDVKREFKALGLSRSLQERSAKGKLKFDIAMGMGKL